MIAALIFTFLLCSFNSQINAQVGCRNMAVYYRMVIGDKVANETQGYDENQKLDLLKKTIVTMDLNKDGKVSMEELTKQIIANYEDEQRVKAQQKFDEVKRLLKKTDANEMKKPLTWDDHIRALQIQEFGTPSPQAYDYLEEKFYKDRKLWVVADLNNDNALNVSEYQAFTVPAEAKHMHRTLITPVMEKYDTNRDGSISLVEFMATILPGYDPKTHPDSKLNETVRHEKMFFNEYLDQNKNGELKGEEIRQWTIPDLERQFFGVVEHMFQMVDTNKDKQLTYDEMKARYNLFVGRGWAPSVMDDTPKPATPKKDEL